ncbi:MAG: SusC/RagA family TonB-linked outer membrane protein [Saprospiraceae bacterium]|nr:SusC/RagA family TonB-linked outer membrane protein [Saprospiraceae bacterium]
MKSQFKYINVFYFIKGFISANGLIVLLTMFSLNILEGQQISLKGVILDDKSSLPIEGVVVRLTGTTTVTSSNALGEFSLLVPDEWPCQLQFSFIGYETENLQLQQVDFIQVRMKESTNELNEVVIVSGYTVQRKSEFTGSVASIQPKQLENRPATSFDQLLGGQASGVDIIQPSSILNSTPIIRIRGLNSITSGIFPLVILDGVAVFVGSIGGMTGNNPLSDINPGDILSVDILKDASSASIYGSRAANGVMVITTKKGKKGRVKMHYDNWVSRSTPFNLPELLSAEDYVMIKNEAMSNSGLTPGYKLMYNPDSSVVNTNWYDVAYRPGFSNNHNFSVGGANQTTSYFLSMGYSNQNSFIKNNSYDRFTTRINLENSILPVLRIGTRMTYSNSFNKSPNTGAIPSNSLSSSAYNSEYITNEPLGRMTYVLPPNVPVFNQDGSYSIQNRISVGYGANNTSVGTINAYNLAMVQALDVNSSENNNIIGNIYGEWDITPYLRFKSSYGINRLLTENNSFLNPIHGGGASANGVATNIFTKYFRYDWANTLLWNRTMSEVHHFQFLLGQEQIFTQINSWGAQRSNITDPDYKNYQGGFANIAPIGNVLTETALLSYFSNLSYHYDKKYFLSLNFRRDGLSALSPSNRYGNFGGGSLAWDLSKEHFFSRNISSEWINQFKLRGSFGVVGNSEIGAFPSISAYTSNTYGGQPTLQFAQAANPNLKWETSKKLDFALHLGMFNDRLQMELGYYHNNIDGMILQSPQALSAGIPGNYIFENFGSMYNRGIELNINAMIIQDHIFGWDVNINLSTLENKVTKLKSDVYVPSIFGVQNMTREGYSIGSIFAVPTIGVNPENGLMVFVNSEGREVQYNHIGSPRWTYLDGTPAPAIDNYRDGVIQGPSLPKLFGGLNQNIRYKNFDLSMIITFASGNLLYNGTRATNSDQRYFNNGTFIKERWTVPGQKTEIQKLYYGDNVSAGFSFSATSKVERGDYIKLKNISFGYTIPFNQSSWKYKINSVRIYAQAVNLFTLTKFRGSDPEVSINGNSIHSGKDQNVPPNAQIFSLGLNVTF